MMKLSLLLTPKRIIVFLSASFALLIGTKTSAQICLSPATVIYGLTANGAIYPINVSNASTGTVVKNTTYSGNSVNRANGLAYNSTNGKFYYFKRNVGNVPQEFVSYDPGTATVSILSSSTCADEVHTGCITANGLYYYTIDTKANLNCYNIVMNTWTTITSAFTDQFGNDVSAVILNQDAGDIAFDGNGNLWIVTANSTNYGVYRVSAPLPTTPVASLTAHQRVPPTTPTPSGNMIAGIAFNPGGQIFMSTKNDNRLYRLENNLSMTFLGTFNVSDVGNDLTSCAFPLGVLPITWLSFTAESRTGNMAELNWQVAEKGSSGFHVQHSTDGKNWSDLSFIPFGMYDTEAQPYSYIHRNTATGKNYYRIKIINELGKETYSEVKMVHNGSGQPTLSVWPNPASASVSISGHNNQAARVRILDMAGRVSLEKQLSSSQATLDITSLKPGNYFLTLYTADGNQYNQKIIKQ